MAQGTSWALAVTQASFLIAKREQEDIQSARILKYPHAIVTAKSNVCDDSRSKRVRLERTFAHALGVGYFICVSAIISFTLNSFPTSPKILHSIEQQNALSTDKQLLTLLDLRASSLRGAMLIFVVSFQFLRRIPEGSRVATGPSSSAKEIAAVQKACANFPVVRTAANGAIGPRAAETAENTIVTRVL